jgi:hypothetical protein
MITPKTIEKQLRKSFKERSQDKTEERKNRFNGESVMLTKEEADRHDCIFLAEHMAEVHTDPDTKDKHYKIMRKHLNWFRQHNAEAYMVLLD